jgi:hypothetical protein
VVKSGLRVVLGATSLVVFAFIEAKKDVPLEIGWGLGSAHPAILGLLVWGLNSSPPRRR